MKHSLSLTAAALVFVCCAVFGLYAAAGQTPSSQEEAAESLSAAAPSPDRSSAPGEAAEERFLRIFDGRLALFTGSGRYPSEVYDLLVRTLPPEDQSRLETGIPISSDEELKRLLEDFMS